MRRPLSLPPPPPADGPGQDRQGLALLLGAAGLCAMIGVAAGWSLLFGPPAVPWPAIMLFAVLAVGVCAGVVAAVRVRDRRTPHDRSISTPPGVGYTPSRDDPSEWS